MHQGQSEVMVLKPTAVFLSFLASQLPEAELPSMELLQTDTTAYTIPKRTSEEATLAELEQRFTLMFRHEIGRWLGKDARNPIENSFLDFLCCFKFEMHDHIILMESSITEGHQAVIIKPRSILLNWAKYSLRGMEGMTQLADEVHLSNLVENATVMVKNFSNLSEIKPFFEHYYKAIFETSMSRMSGNKDRWPLVHSFQAFRRYFTVQIHTQLMHL